MYFEHVPVQSFKEKLEERKKPINTQFLQVSSLIRFAKNLGYKNVEKNVWGTWGGNGFEQILTKDLPRFVSFNTMKYWHNNPENKYTPSRLNDAITVAAEYKLVERVKLQKTKYGVEVQNHYVKLLGE